MLYACEWNHLSHCYNKLPEGATEGRWKGLFWLDEGVQFPTGGKLVSRSGKLLVTLNPQ